MKEQIDMVMDGEQMVGIGTITPDWREWKNTKVNIKALRTALDIFAKIGKNEIEVAVANDKMLLIGEAKPNGKFVGVAIAQDNGVKTITGTYIR